MALQISWRECDSVILSLGRRDGHSRHEEGKAKDCLSFLAEIGFWDTARNELTPEGELYFNARWVLQDEDEANRILRNMLMVYAPVQYICQTFWGRRATTSVQIENLLRHHQVLRKGETASSLLALLNRVGILTYSKKSGQIHVKINPFPDQNADISPLSHRVISPETQYTNVKNIRQVIRSCQGFVWWLDKFFDKRGLEPLAEECDGKTISEVRILSGDEHVSDAARKDYERFRSEANTKGVIVAWRVISDKASLAKIHDRFIIAQNLAYNIPPLSAIFKGQYSEISLASSSLSGVFEEFWSRGKELIEKG